MARTSSPTSPAAAERYSCFANRTVGWRAVGGKLVATSDTLWHEPNFVERLLGGKRWSVPLASVSTVGLDLPNGNLLDGGVRCRLLVTTDDGARHLFVVGDVDDAMARLKALLPR
jgi:hypothetical protein